MIIRFVIPVLAVFMIGVSQAEAVSTLTFPLERPTSRTIERTERYLRIIDYLQRKKGIVRTRNPVGRLQEQDRTSLRRWDIRNVRRQRTTSAHINRQRTYQTPTLSRARLSLNSTVPVDIDTQVAYRNGVKYYKGDGVPKNFIYAYMWFSYALADGHPLARSSLLTVQRRMSQTQIDRAQRLRDDLSFSQLTLADATKASIRDSVRQNTADDILDALVRYARDSNSRYPDQIPHMQAKEICHPDSFRCRGYLDFDALLPTYALEIPVDPLVPDDSRGSGYAVYIDERGYLTVESLYAERSDVIARYRSW